MREPSVRSSRRAIAGGILAVILVGTGGFLLGRSTTVRETPPSPAPAEGPSPVPPPHPSAPQILDRAAIIELGRQAADAFASGTQPRSLQTDVAGRRFTLVLPFGCSGPAGADSTAALRWRYDETSHALRIQITETRWQPEDWGLPQQGETRSRGFWISHPWSSSERCPVASADLSSIGPAPIILPGQTLAVASFADADTAALVKPLVAVIKRKEDDAKLPHGLRARITGRIDHMPSGAGPVRCVQPAGIEQQPVCAIAVTFDELSVDDPITGETLATWNLN